MVSPNQRQKNGISRSAYGNLVVSLVAIVVAIFLAEAGLRIFLPQPGFILQGDDDPPGLWAPDSILGFRYAAGYSGQFSRADFDVSVVLNAQGYRVEHNSTTLESGKHQILAVGDSLTFGWGVESDEAWPTVLARELSRYELAGRELGVINAGVSGYNLEQIAKRVRMEVVLQWPNLVILGLYVGGLDRINNSFHLVDGGLFRGDVLPRLKRHKDGYLISKMNCPSYISLDHWLSEHFYFGALIWKKLGWHLDKFGDYQNEKIANRAELQKEAGPRLSNVTSIVLDVANFLHSRNIDLMVVLMVTQEPNGQISDKQKSSALVLERQLAQQSVHIFNTLSLLDSAAGRPVFRFERDGHWNRDAHTLVGRNLASYIYDAGLLKNFKGPLPPKTGGEGIDFYDDSEN